MEKLFKIINKQLKVFCADFKAKNLEYVLKDISDSFGPFLTIDDRMALNTSKKKEEDMLKVRKFFNRGCPRC